MRARAATRRPAKHVAQDILEAAAAAAREAVGTKAEAFEMAGARTKTGAASWMRTETLEALEARLAFRVNLAAVVSLTLLVVADDLVCGIYLGEARGRLRGV